MAQLRQRARPASERRWVKASPPAGRRAPVARVGRSEARRSMAPSPIVWAPREWNGPEVDGPGRSGLPAVEGDAEARHLAPKRGRADVECLGDPLAAAVVRAQRLQHGLALG